MKFRDGHFQSVVDHELKWNDPRTLDSVNCFLCSAKSNSDLDLNEGQLGFDRAVHACC